MDGLMDGKTDSHKYDHHQLLLASLMLADQ